MMVSEEEVRRKLGDVSYAIECLEEMGLDGDGLAVLKAQRWVFLWVLGEEEELEVEY